MNPKDIQAFIPYLVIAFVAFIILIVVLRRILVNVGAREIAIKERRYLGAKMPPGRVVATEGEVGIQADVLKPGLHLIKWPFEKVIRKFPLIEIGPDEMGIIEAIDGEPMPPGGIFAADRAQNAHNNFQDPIAFIKRGGVKGIQLRTLPPGLWPIHPYLFRVSVTKTTVIPQGKVGIVTSADGAQLRSEEHTSELQSPCNLVCRLLLEKKKKKKKKQPSPAQYSNHIRQAIQN